MRHSARAVATWPISLPLRCQARAVSSVSKPSPIATSSDVTLDDLASIPNIDSIQSLDYATDTELIDAILVKPPHSIPKYLQSRFFRLRSYVPEDIDWNSSVDPALAFLALRRRPSFGRFLQYIRPQVGLVYDQLQPSGIFQFFASDVLIRSGDKKLVRELLQLIGDTPRKLRTSATISLWEHIREDVISGELDPLSQKSMVAVAHAFMREGQDDKLDRLWEDLYGLVKWNRKTAWAFYQIILEKTRRGDTDTALKMIDRLVKDDRILTSDDRLDPNHPKAKTLLIQTIVLRALIRLQVDGGSQIAALDLLKTMEDTSILPQSHDMFMELCRTMIVTQDPPRLTWAGKFLVRYAKMSGAPPLDRNIIDLFIQNNRSDDIAVRWYRSLPPNHEPPSPLVLVRLAKDIKGKGHAEAILKDVSRLSSHEFAPHRTHILSALIEVLGPDLNVTLSETWNAFDPRMAVSMIRMLTQSKDLMTQYQSSIESITQRYWEFAKSDPESPIRAIDLVQIYRFRKETKQIESLGLHDMIKRNQKRVEVKEYLDELLRQSPAEAYNLIDYLRKHAELEYALPIDNVIVACLFGKWGELDRLGKDVEGSSTPEQARVLSVLRSIKDRKTGNALEQIKAMKEETDVHVRLYRGVGRAAVLEGNWVDAASAWLQALDGDRSPADLVALRHWGRSMLHELQKAMKREEDVGVEGLLKSDIWAQFGEALTGISIRQTSDFAVEKEEEEAETTRKLWLKTKLNAEVWMSEREA